MSVYQRTRKGPDGKPYLEEIYTADFEANKQRYVFSTGKTLKADAEKIERDVRRELKANRIPDLLQHLRQRQAPAQFATLKQLCASYTEAPLENSRSTRDDNVQALLLLLRKLKLTDAPTVKDLDKEVSTGILTPEVIRDYFRAVVKECADLTQDEANSKKRTANGLMVKVLSMFTPAARAWYADSHLKLPDLDAITAACKAAEFKRIPKKTYHPPADSIIHRTLTEWEQMTDRNMFFTVGTALSFGLRKGEISQVQTNWFTVSSGRPTLTNQPEAGAHFKNGAGLIRIAALDPYWTTLRTIAATRFNLNLDGQQQFSPDNQPEFLLTGTPTERTSECFNRVSDWMRSLGWNMQKTNHALRDYAGSMIALKFSIWEASVWLRHSTVKVTEDSYTSFVSHAAMIDRDKLPIAWATATAKQFQPVIVQAAGA